MLNGFNDPKTVELRPIVNTYAQTDAVNIMDEIGAPTNTMDAPPGIMDNHEVVFTPPKSDSYIPRPPLATIVENGVNTIQGVEGETPIITAAAVSRGDINNEKIPPLLPAIIDSYTNLDTTNTANDDDGATKMAIPPYNIDNAIRSVQAFRNTFFFFVYDSASDTFVIIHNIPGCNYGCQRIYRIASTVAFALRKNFPGRFQSVVRDGELESSNNDLVIMISCGDVPRIKVQCLSPLNNYCDSVDFSPILQFGSIFVDAQYLPSMIAMPLPVRPHLPCFEEWQGASDFGRRSGVCQDLQPKVDLTSTSIKSGLVFGQELGLLEDAENYWDNLIPQIIWRGTDFGFLHTMFHDLRSPEYRLDIAPKEGESPTDEVEKKRWAIKTLWEMGDDLLLPRWRGVLLTSEAELEASLAVESRVGDDTTGNTNPILLPWVNIKFANINVGGKKVPASENEEYRILQNLGITAIGERVSMIEQAKYKYHIDLGGGGGTTWTGTIEKLALPGVLFHHVTPTKDWFHDLLVPWEHYVPITTDLSDLRKKYEWAESHPVEAKQIAEAGTRFARWMGSVEGFGHLYREHLVDPLRNVLRAYKPMPPRYAGKSALDVINETRGGEEFAVIGRCSGLHTNSCEELV